MKLSDMLFANALMGEGGGGGGGGGGDFSTAKVGIVLASDRELSFYGLVWDEGLSANIITGIVKKGDHWTDDIYWVGEINTTADVVLLENEVTFTCSDSSTPVITGSARTEHFEDDGQYYIYITGDCTITIS